MAEGRTEARYYFAAGYAACAAIAFTASRTRSAGVATRTGPFWLRIAILCVVFAMLRSFDANMIVSAALNKLSHSIGERLGPYLMVAAMVAFGAAVAGLLLFRGQTLHSSIRLAAMAIVLLVLLAIAQSVSLYAPVVILQEMVGPLTVSRIIEALLLISLASSAAWFIHDARSDDASRHET